MSDHTIGTYFEKEEKRILPGIHIPDYQEGFKFEICKGFFERCFDLIISIDGDFFEWRIFGIGFKVRVFIAVIRHALSNSAVDFLLEKESILKIIRSVRPRLRLFQLFNRITAYQQCEEGLRFLRDNLAYSEYGIRLMLAPRSAKALQEKVLLKLHGIKRLPGSPSLDGTLFWIIAELLSLKKAA
ncbi:hypothetical protein Tco_1154821 [Tanacetum coccineum]